MRNWAAQTGSIEPVVYLANILGGEGFKTAGPPECFEENKNTTARSTNSRTPEDYKNTDEPKKIPPNFKNYRKYAA